LAETGGPTVGHPAQDVATRTYVRESMGARENVDVEILRDGYRAR
jgi:hypothetical protein